MATRWLFAIALVMLLSVPSLAVELLPLLVPVMNPPNQLPSPVVASQVQPQPSDRSRSERVAAFESPPAQLTAEEVRFLKEWAARVWRGAQQRVTYTQYGVLVS